MMTLEKVKWGFIGCGEVTEKKSGPAFSMIRNSEVVAVMSRDAEKAASYARRHNIPRWYNDPQLLIGDEDVNAIYIATPPSSHATYAIMAMKAGKPVYIEKPMAASYEDCARINRISKETGIPCFVAYYRRYLPYFQKVKDIVASGEIGNVINVQIRFAAPPRDLDYNNKNLPWRVQADIAGGHLFVIEDGEILHGVFAFFPEGDLIYDTLPVIWQNTLPHGAIHRVASAGTARGVLRACVEFCLSVCDNLKIDTHKDNIVMQNALARLGFARCGVAEIPDVGERIVFQLCKKEQV